SREDALAQLADSSSFYRKSEPHSPIPYLLDRAIRWSNMSLEEWLAEALKDDNALTNVRETLGTMFQR
ncbi:MAG: type VI secretion system protein TssA, partial [Blastocatellia bacterium]|nr:type VI secretion system protein TssA [Blastocatellia bacterium]